MTIYYTNPLFVDQNLLSIKNSKVFSFALFDPFFNLTFPTLQMGCTVDPQNPLTEEENQNQIFKENVLWSCKHVIERKETFREDSLSKCRQLIINKDSDFADVSKVDDIHKSYMGCVGQAITSSITGLFWKSLINSLHHILHF